MKRFLNLALLLVAVMCCFISNTMASPKGEDYDDGIPANNAWPEKGPQTVKDPDQWLQSQLDQYEKSLHQYSKINQCYRLEKSNHTECISNLIVEGMEYIKSLSDAAHRLCSTYIKGKITCHEMVDKAYQSSIQYLINVPAPAFAFGDDPNAQAHIAAATMDVIHQWHLNLAGMQRKF